MAIQITTTGDLDRGGALMEASDGTKLAVIMSNTRTDVRLYSDIDGTPVLEDTDVVTTIFGGDTIGWLHAAIDSSDNIHIIAVCNAQLVTRDVAYCLATESGGAWTFGAWEAVLATYTNTAPDVKGCAISIDSSDYPHVLFVDNVKDMGTAGDNVYYDERTGGSWAGATQIGLRDTKTDFYRQPAITLRNSDYIEAVSVINAVDTVVRTYTGSWSVGETAYLGDETFGVVVATTSGTYYLFHADGSNIEENGADTTYNTHGTSNRISGALVDDSDRYVFYIDTGQDVHLISNDGGGWTDKGVLQVGTYGIVIAEWAYNNENQVDEINYIFEISSTVYYDSYNLAVRRVFITPA